MKPRLLPALLLSAAAPIFAAPEASPAGRAVADAVNAVTSALAGGGAAPAADKASLAQFSAEERDALRSLAKDVTAALKESGLPADAPISALPFPGDRERYLEGLLKNAVTDAGLNYVEGRTDPMWDAIVSEINWEDPKADVLDEATLTKFGRLQATRQLLYGRLLLDRDEEDEPRAELWLHVSSVETKQHRWGKTFVGKPGFDSKRKEALTFVDFPVVLADALLTLRVDSAAADDAASSKTLAAAMGSDARDTLAAAGFAVIDGDKAKDAEIAVTIKSSAPAFDREDDYVRFSGNVEIAATLPADRNRVIGEKTTLVRRSKRALGDAAALDNLREDMVTPLRDWLGKTVTAEKIGLRSVTLQADFAKIDEPELEQRIATLVDAAGHLDGVRDARVVSRLPLPDGEPGTRVTLRVLFRPVDVPEGIGTRLVAQRPDLFKKAKKAK